MGVAVEVVSVCGSVLLICLALGVVALTVDLVVKVWRSW